MTTGGPKARDPALLALPLISSVLPGKSLRSLTSGYTVSKLRLITGRTMVTRMHSARVRVRLHTRHFPEACAPVFQMPGS